MRIPRSGSAQLFGILAFLAVVSCVREDVAPASSIEPAELAVRLSSDAAPVILDVRSPEEFASGHIPGAVNVPLGELSDRLVALEISPTEEVVVHCQRGGRAAAAESILRESGYRNVRDLSGHMEAWRAGGYPIE